MISERVLDLAVANGLLSAGQAVALRSLARQEEAALPPARPEPVDEERLRFVSGFADIFVTLGLVLFLGSAAYLAGRSLGGGWTAALAAALAWGLAEFFSRARRMALPSIVLLVVFTAASFVALASLMGVGGAPLRPRLGWLDVLVRPGRDPLPTAVAAIGTVLLATLHYLRFRVPITVAAGVGALALSALLSLYATAPELAERSINMLLVAIGCAVFALAMRFDLSDPGRTRRSTDIAFWLHMLAAPMIVHSVFQAIGAGHGTVDPAMAVGVLAVFAGLGLIGIVIDRRALLVSGLVYAGVAFGSLIRRAGLSDLSLPVTLLALGALVLLLSAGWTPLRRLLLGWLPADFAARLPRPLPV